MARQQEQFGIVRQAGADVTEAFNESAFVEKVPGLEQLGHQCVWDVHGISG
jgi:hypothetical protein